MHFRIQFKQHVQLAKTHRQWGPNICKRLCESSTNTSVTAYCLPVHWTSKVLHSIRCHQYLPESLWHQVLQENYIKPSWTHTSFSNFVQSHQPWNDVFRCLSDALIPLHVEGMRRSMTLLTTFWKYCIIEWHSVEFYHEILAIVSSPPNPKWSLYFQIERSWDIWRHGKGSRAHPNLDILKQAQMYLFYNELSPKFCNAVDASVGSFNYDIRYQRRSQPV